MKQFLLVALATAVAARKCQNITVPITITSHNTKFDLEAPATEIDVTNFFVNYAVQGSDYGATIATGKHVVTGEYKLATTYCYPDSGPGDTIQFLTHGVGFDRSYWDFPFNNYNYSYVEQAVDMHGYSTLSWDRLGVGESSHGEAVNEIQVFLELAALKELTDRLTAGTICGIDHKYEKKVHIGHSFGSVLTYALSSEHPDITNGIVLTGFAQAGSFIGLFALGGNFAPVSEIPTLAGKYPVGYVAPKSSIGVQINFFGPGDFDPEILEAATVTGQPAAVGELLAIGAPISKPSQYTGPVLIITGDRDVPFCGGDCSNTAVINNSAPNLLEASKKNFAKASSFNATVVPLAGHNLNYAYSHVSSTDTILDFIGRSV